MTITEFEKEWHDDSNFINAKTSGSTGSPKPIRLLKSDMKASAIATNAFFGLGPGSVYACPLDFDYIAAKMMAVRADVVGGVVAAIPPSNNFYISYAIDLLAIVPSQADCLLRHPEWASAIKNVIIGGAPLSRKRADALVDAGFNCWQTYGMTETCSHVALRRLESSEYTALPGVTFSVDERGCLIIDAPHFAARRFVTNDIVTLLSPTTFVWHGRYDNVINSGGIKIHPEELEARIKDLLNPDFDFYITGRADEKWGQAVVLVAEAEAEILAKVEQQLSNVLDHKELPKAYESVDALPRTANGKLKRI